MNIFSIFKSSNKTKTEKAVDKVISELKKNELEVDMIGTDVFRVNMKSLRKSDVVKAQLTAAIKSSQVVS
ncbi:hypothetical protein [Pseudoalteromonas sp. SR44-2]|uniref:hypothetical protein n=1 Tax=Pseudoalteromonas sp. SR44-2 TaxID=2760937 RepID=UPI00160151D8|nr:hypothetical protein [Pseudoalteromonas sp. SR44-2]MBB1338218.1 hypothetical protein [Pseudoalteromonas sp. SR44-2]